MMEHELGDLAAELLAGLRSIMVCCPAKIRLGRPGTSIKTFSTHRRTRWRPVDRELVQARLRSGSQRGSPVQHTGMCGVVSRRSIRPAVARMVMASSIPRTAVAVSGIV